ncbi:hypothetical protein FH972_001976 [Carpinus fangiana]|uniref:Uncharacterized protein n=1 Tax=Carpinus fangiana TaxID=176857 RepID=A0A5N6QFT6_9ROSI|nr:hypothetical protein FH972_001976 [Carpinus fangiana]
MSSISQGFVLATAMVVSSTALFLAYCRQRSFPATQLSENQNLQQPEKKILRSCLCSENVKEPSGNGEEYRKGHMKSREIERSCRVEIREVRRMPENRVALYGGILKNRVQRMQCSY